MQPINIKNLSLLLPHKVCFEDFTTQIPYGSKIAIIGDNGCGKTTLLNALCGQNTLIDGDIKIPPAAKVAYVPQIIPQFTKLSGGQRFNKALTAALTQKPNILLLDEPTNHLDICNRKSLMGMLDRFEGTLIIVSHDRELLRSHIQTLWHIDNGQIIIFSGAYDNYIAKRRLLRGGLETKLNLLDKDKKAVHKKLMREQVRAASSRQHGQIQREHGRWAPIVAGSKERQAQNTTAQKAGDIKVARSDINVQISDIKIPAIITPTFNLAAQSINHTPLFIADGQAAYGQKIILKDINFTLQAGARAALIGANASGKTTLLRAIMGDKDLTVSGLWEVPKLQNIGYLDQHYNNLPADKTVLDYISTLYPVAHAQIRKHLNDFLFRKTEEVTAKIATLSGGERARLCLAAIACNVPQLLILDEITNNIDIQTKEHIENILKAYPGAMLVVSHEADFIKTLNITDTYLLSDATLSKV